MVQVCALRHIWDFQILRITSIYYFQPHIIDVYIHIRKGICQIPRMEESQSEIIQIVVIKLILRYIRSQTI